MEYRCEYCFSVHHDDIIRDIVPMHNVCPQCGCSSVRIDAVQKSRGPKARNLSVKLIYIHDFDRAGCTGCYFQYFRDEAYLTDPCEGCADGIWVYRDKVSIQEENE